ncbi:unnamed protein product [Linum trigynum]|uniref:Uncharacterized protein n=1 Tax=Linum trigynum TaxID=586398 RepID=A0AAV2EQQ4_9ROSI
MEERLCRNGGNDDNSGVRCWRRTMTRGRRRPDWVGCLVAAEDVGGGRFAAFRRGRVPTTSRRQEDEGGGIGVVAAEEVVGS